jgi:recombination protein RecR
MNEIPSRLVENAVNEISRLPGIGRKTALRLVLHLLRKEPSEALALGDAIIRMRQEIRFCERCHNISDGELCSVCIDGSRDQGVLCVVEDVRDMMALEHTHQFTGLYHILGGIISPMDGIGPEQLNAASLFRRVGENSFREVILALPTTVEGDTTNFYLYRHLKDSGMQVTTLARGVAVGDELEYADEVTLGRSIRQRLPYEDTLRRD